MEKPGKQHNKIVAALGFFYIKKLTSINKVGTNWQKMICSCETLVPPIVCVGGPLISCFAVTVGLQTSDYKNKL